MAEIAERELARRLWLHASRSTAIASAALLLLSRGEKASIPLQLADVGLNWVALDPYVVALFGVPVLTVLCLWTIYAARFYTRTFEHPSFPAAVPTRTDLEVITNRRRAKQIAAWSLVIFIAFPLFTLGMLQGKFLNGSVHFAAHGPYSCRPDHTPPSDCENLGGGLLSHLWPRHGVANMLDTHYRYEGNKTYLPPWEPAFFLLGGLAVWVCVMRYALVFFLCPTPPKRE